MKHLLLYILTLVFLGSCVDLTDDEQPFTEGVEIYLTNRLNERVVVSFSNAEGVGSVRTVASNGELVLPIDLYSDSMYFSFQSSVGMSDFSIRYDIEVLRNIARNTIRLKNITGYMDERDNVHRFRNQWGLKIASGNDFDFINNANNILFIE